jgi:hypothetical protein
MQIMHDRSLIQMGQLCHVIRLVKFCGINFVSIICVNFSLLVDISGVIEVTNLKPTDPSSHCIKSLPPGKSSTTQPLTKAASVSLSQTYLFPEKSFSPSMPSTVGIGLCGFSDLMKVGANVPVAGVVLRYDPERFLVESLRPGPCCWRVLRGENDW